VVEVIRSGAIGAVRQVHVFVNSHYSLKPPVDHTPQPPPAFHWDTWLGPAPEQAYRPDYHPERWRMFWDFGGGTLGDFGCHHLDLSFWALDLRHPTAVEARGPAPDPVHPPDELQVDYDFAARGGMPPVRITWVHGAKRPAVWEELGAPKWGNGTLFVGDKGLLVADYSKYQLLPQERFAGFAPPPPSIPKSIGHHEEWIQACKEGTPTLCNFDYGGALTETVLLGNVAHRAGNKRLEWDAANLRVTNDAGANRLLATEYRTGWEI
jgi:predicted dehydrogenase